MKILFLLISLLVFSPPSLSTAQEELLLRVGIDSFTPPFVMEGANRQFFGFDISMMQYICQMIKRRCVFVSLPFEELIPAVEIGKVDVAVSALTITSERVARVNFSSPYLLSLSRFLGPSQLATKNFGLHSLNDQRIGIEKGTVFPAVINALGIKNPKIIEFEDAPHLIDALQAGKVDLVLLDAPSAMYWQMQSSGRFSVLGNAFAYGFGFGIAITPQEPELLQVINKALALYMNSKEFKREYGKYIGENDFAP
ncbi:putative amino acid ABC transporter, periplasmic binding protein [Legionella lansingensis]|uniref:Putative amino acid ABC transporter, periplasmic binding protein n=1 Tax=Legionella lansingensis TaxID=45067 RepID=A0A0W0VFG2_9GAMM|nr:transporter substrate-binding domain-containing protein [Legionella lansingensis]KTD18856.1 putative amino acid ABC transporter, periplasmic binding protein [Legionella lansingensis]SNV52762.1 putative amino acid ABC transporter, periplasmic binding protein [Legionella lansingensis]